MRTQKCRNLWLVLVGFLALSFLACAGKANFRDLGDEVAQSLINCAVDPPPPGCPPDTTMVFSKNDYDVNLKVLRNKEDGSWSFTVVVIPTEKQKETTAKE